MTQVKKEQRLIGQRFMGFEIVGVLSNNIVLQITSIGSPYPCYVYYERNTNVDLMLGLKKIKIKEKQNDNK